MNALVTSCPAVPKGLAFEIDSHAIIADWARRHDHRAVVRIDHGVENEEYEEAIMLHFGVHDRCRFILWRSADSVFVQPLIGRRQGYASVAQALAGSLLNKDARGYGLVRIVRFSAA